MPEALAGNPFYPVTNHRASGRLAGDGKAQPGMALVVFAGQYRKRAVTGAGGLLKNALEFYRFQQPESFVKPAPAATQGRLRRSGVPYPLPGAL